MNGMVGEISVDHMKAAEAMDVLEEMREHIADQLRLLQSAPIVSRKLGTARIERELRAIALALDALRKY